MQAAKKILIYDGSCATCRVMKNAAYKTVSNYDFVDSTSTEGKRLIAENSLDIEKSAYVLDSGKVLSRSDMALEVIGDIRFIGPIFAGVGRIVPRAWRDGMYGWVVRHRIR